MDIEQSFENVVDKIIGFIPNLVSFIIILIVGYIIAKIVSVVVRKVLQKVGVDQKLKDSASGTFVDSVLPGKGVTTGVSKVVFWLVFVYPLVAAIGALEIPSVTSFMNQVLNYLPNVVAAFIIFVVAAVIAGAAAKAIANFLGDSPVGKIAGAVVPAIVMVIAMFMILTQLHIAPQIVQLAFAATVFALALGLALAFGLGGRGVAERILEDAYRNGRVQKDQMKSDIQARRDGGASEATGATTTESAPVSDPNNPDSTW